MRDISKSSQRPLALPYGLSPQIQERQSVQRRLTAHAPKLRTKAGGLGSLPGEMDKNCGLFFDCSSSPLAPHEAVPIIYMLGMSPFSPTCPHPLGSSSKGVFFTFTNCENQCQPSLGPNAFPIHTRRTLTPSSLSLPHLIPPPS